MQEMCLVIQQLVAPQIKCMVDPQEIVDVLELLMGQTSFCCAPWPGLNKLQGLYFNGNAGIVDYCGSFTQISASWSSKIHSTRNSHIQLWSYPLGVLKSHWQAGEISKLLCICHTAEGGGTIPPFPPAISLGSTQENKLKFFLSISLWPRTWVAVG